MQQQNDAVNGDDVEKNVDKIISTFTNALEFFEKRISLLSTTVHSKKGATTGI